MEGGLQMSFHGIELSAALEARFASGSRNWCGAARKLTGGRVAIEKEGRNHVKGNTVQGRLW